MDFSLIERLVEEYHLHQPHSVPTRGSLRHHSDPNYAGYDHGHHFRRLEYLYDSVEYETFVMLIRAPRCFRHFCKTPTDCWCVSYSYEEVEEMYDR